MQGQGSIADLTGGQRQLSNKVYLWNGRQFGTDEDNSSSSGISSDKGWRSNVSDEERPLSDLYLTMLQRLGVETDSFGGSKTTVSET